MTEPRSKQRHSNHITGAKGVRLVANALPDHWVVREINPDYGLDLHVEAFARDPNDPKSANALGEHFYIQVKTTEHEVPVRDGRVKISIDTPTLLTVEKMGAAVPALLCLVDLAVEKVYYVCLNDYITKVLVAERPDYDQQKSVTLHIPSRNVLDSASSDLSYIWLLARRAKYYAAFNLLGFQLNELRYAQGRFVAEREGEEGIARISPGILDTLRIFLRSTLRLDVWDFPGPGMWAPLTDVYTDFRALLEDLPLFEGALSHDDAMLFEHRVFAAFGRAANLGRMYEDLVRQWRLPTRLGELVD